MEPGAERAWFLFRDAAGRPMARYMTGALPAGEKRPSVAGSCFTFPIHTPSGVDVTDLGPADHPHHRGVFCGWVKVEGERPGDWWGWGALAPKDGRAVENGRIQSSTAGGAARLEAVNAWKADGVTVLQETLTLSASQEGAANILDYDYRYSAPTDHPVILAQNPFGGFCYRARPRGALVVTGPDGEVMRPDSVYNQAERNWPASRWYDLTYHQPDGAVNGVAVLDAPSNPPTTWHIARGLHMLNPCIAASGPVTIRPGKALRLRYRLVAHDGDAASARLDRLYDEWAQSR